jgi:phage-related protein
MPAITFTPPRPPTIDATRTIQPRVIVASFGDGYSQRTGAGLNTQPQVWSLTWGPMGAADIDTIEAFFAARRGVEPFRWTPPRESSPRVFVCPEWQVIERGASLAELTARFDEVFDLGA